MFIDYLQLVEDYATLKISGKRFYSAIKEDPKAYFKLTSKVS